MIESPFGHSSFSQNRQRLIDHDVTKLFFAQVVEQARKSDPESKLARKSKGTTAGSCRKLRADSGCSISTTASARTDAGEIP